MHPFNILILNKPLGHSLANVALKISKYIIGHLSIYARVQGDASDLAEGLGLKQAFGKGEDLTGDV